MTTNENLLLKLLGRIRDGVYFVDRNRRITFWNEGAERITGFRAEQVIGSGCGDNVLEHIDSEGRGLCTGECPLSAIIRGEIAECEAEILLHHREGHRVPVTVRALPILDESGTVVGAAEIFSESGLAESYTSVMEDLRKAALLDPLTGIANRRYLDMKLAQSLSDLDRYDVPFGVILLDVDRFKEVNDTWGHAVGDRILKMVAETLRMNVRGSDLAARYGGDEFLIVAPHVAFETLERLAEKLRVLIGMGYITENGGRISVTATMGGTIATSDDTAETLVRRADRFLYEARREGRNRSAVG
jgi:diguanylate cyclase (GGDEF)-like protein/PAS domain S-box-containing protein